MNTRKWGHKRLIGFVVSWSILTAFFGWLIMKYSYPQKPLTMLLILLLGMGIVVLGKIWDLNIKETK